MIEEKNLEEKDESWLRRRKRRRDGGNDLNGEEEVEDNKGDKEE